MRLFEEKQEYLERWELPNGFADALIHWGWWRLPKRYTACVCVWPPGSSEPTVCHQRAWNRKQALQMVGAAKRVVARG